MANKSNKPEEHWQRYRETRRAVKTKIKSSDADYIKLTVSYIDRNPKRFWNYVKVRKSETVSIECLNVNGVKITGSELMAEALNGQFNSVFNTERTIEPPHHDPFDLDQGMDIMCDIECNTHEVHKLLKDTTEYTQRRRRHFGYFTHHTLCLTTGERLMPVTKGPSPLHLS